MNFDGGTGGRFLTMFALDAGPITNQQIVYIYNGLIADQRYLVTAHVQLKSTVLPAEYDQGTNFPI